VNATPAPPYDTVHTIIAPSTGGYGVSELLAYRELLMFLVWRDIKVRYKQTLLGVAWVVIQPLATMAVFSLFFGKLARIPSDGLPYPLFAFSGLLPWMFFANAVSQSAASLVGSANLIRKVYFPRVLVPLASVLAGLVDLIPSLGVLALLMFWFGVTPAVSTAAVPALLLLAVIAAVGPGLWLAGFNVRYRDVRYIVPFLVQFWLFVTPVSYPVSLLPQQWRLVYALNPMVGVVEGFRWAALGRTEFPAAMLAVSATTALIVLISGVLVFRRIEHSFPDTV
jgi:lipopolysaccharide transport system permease protein